jgi:hypothetical protein
VATRVTKQEFEALRFLRQFGFEEDPFASTNAAEEPHLRSYFVEPPYFATVMGDPLNPRSHVVLAPRGGGKTAQRRMLEDASQEQRILCITYDSFDLPDRFRIEDATWDYHATQVVRLLVVGILAALLDAPSLAERLDGRDKRHLRYYVDEFVGSMSEEEFKRATAAIKSLPEKAKELWERFRAPVKAGINVILVACGLVKLDGAGGDQEPEEKPDESMRYHLQRLTEIARTLGFASTYILVDRVDEIPLTATDASRTLQFIHPLVTDLPTLEMDGSAFKFFLWDRIEDEYRESGGRPDRVPIYTLAWSSDDLQQMMSRRLSALSRGNVESLNQLTCDDVTLDLHALMAELASGSPRDLIRMMARIVAEQTRTSDDAPCISDAAIWEGIRKFSDERANELIGQYLPDLRRIGARGQVTFTIPQLASDVFRITTQAARSKVQKWQQTGLVAQIGELPNPGNRPMHLFGAVDPRLAIAMLRTTGPDEILGNYGLYCPSCDHLVLSDRDEIVCPNCNREFQLGAAQSVLERCQVR